MAGAGARRPSGDRGAEPARRLGAHGAYALRFRKALFARTADGDFTPGATAEALFFPPTTSRPILKFRRYLEHTGRRLWPLFSGVIVVEAQKRLYQGLPVTQRVSRRVFVPVLAPQGVPTTRTAAGQGKPR